MAFCLSIAMLLTMLPTAFAAEGDGGLTGPKTEETTDYTVKYYADDWNVSSNLKETKTIAVPKSAAGEEIQQAIMDDAATKELTQTLTSQLASSDTYYYIPALSYIYPMSSNTYWVMLIQKSSAKITSVSPNGAIQYRTDADGEWQDYTADTVLGTNGTYPSVQVKCSPLPDDVSAGKYYTLDESQFNPAAGMTYTRETDGSIIFTFDCTPDGTDYCQSPYCYVPFMLDPLPTLTPEAVTELTLDAGDYQSIYVQQDREDNYLITMIDSEGVQSKKAYLAGTPITLTGTNEAAGSVDVPKISGTLTGGFFRVAADVQNLSLTLDNAQITQQYSRKAVVLLEGGAQANITLRGTNTMNASYAGAISLLGAANATLNAETDGNLAITTTGVDYAAIYVAQDAALTISGGNYSIQSGGAGIGSSMGSDRAAATAGRIVINGTADVSATGGNYSAGIGGGEYGNASYIEISGNAKVYAKGGGNNAAGIGGGAGTNAKNFSSGVALAVMGGHCGRIVLDGQAQVTAISGSLGTAIGRGGSSDHQAVAVSDTDSLTIGADVTVLAAAMGDISKALGKTEDYFAIDTGLSGEISATILNGRFAVGEVTPESGTDVASPIEFMTSGTATESLILPVGYRAFAFTANLAEGSADTFGVRNAEECAKKGWGAYYTAEAENTRVYNFPLTVNTMLTKDDLHWGVSHTVTFASNGGSAVAAQNVNDQMTAVRPTAPSRGGYTFVDWYSDSGLRTVYSFDTPVTEDITLYAYWSPNKSGGGSHSSTIPDHNPPLAPDLNKDDHFAYVIGYPQDYVTGEATTDKNRWPVRPEANIDRQEVATIFFRLLTDDSRVESWKQTNSFNDVPSSQWSNNAISTMANAEIVNGYEDGSFRPESPITRGEFAAIAARFDSSLYVGDDKFSDIAGHWAAEYINRAAQKGWISGYPDGTFHPNQYITRAEAMTLINNVLDRRTHAADMLDDMVKWPDNLSSAWYYEAVQEATNGHDYDRENATDYEKWTKMQTPRDWAALEKEWATAAANNVQS